MMIALSDNLNMPKSTIINMGDAKKVAIYHYLGVDQDEGPAYVTSQRERVPQSMGIQHSQANIKGDMSNFMKNIENFISNYFCV